MEQMPTQAEISTNDPSRIVVDTPFVMKDHVKAVPGAKWNTDADPRKWTIPLSWTACLALNDEYPGLIIGPNLRAWAMQVGPVKKWLRSHRLNIDLDPADIYLNELVAGEEFKWLFPHQRVDALSIFRSGGSYLLLNDVGTGKTAAALAGHRLQDISTRDHDTLSPYPVLIVAPKSMLRTWRNEIRGAFPDAWGEDQRTISIVDGTPTVVRKALEPGFDYYIIGWELLRRYSRIAGYGSTPIPEGANVDKELNALGISTIIGDEIHRITDPTSQRSRAFKYLAHRANYRIGLTGTIIQEGAIDPWHIIHCIFPDEYPTKSSYIARYLTEEWGDWGERVIGGLNPTREEEFRKNWEAVTRRMTTDIIPDLPPPVNNVRWVTLPAKHRKAYNQMKNNLVAEIEGGTITAANQLVKAGRLVQLANSYGELIIEDDGTERFKMTDESPKLDALMEDIDNGDYAGHQVIIYSESKQLLRFLAARLDKKHGDCYVQITGDVTGEDRQTAMEAFQAGQKQYCLLTSAGGEGITLTAADTMVRLVRPWSYRTDVQVAARNRRIGSQIHEFINYIDYLVEDTIDETKVVRLNTKGEAAEDYLHDGELLAMLQGMADAEAAK
jgi:SNF2 family DNA or RNA helicase